MKQKAYISNYFCQRIPALLGLFLALTGSALASPFTYQGRLTEGGVVPPSGQYDITFGLWDAATDGNAVGSPTTLAPVATTNGVFTVTLDFGNGVFNGAGRWLQISVRPNGSQDPYQVLTPRQAVTFSPQAGFALSVADGAVTPGKITGVINAANIPSLDAGKITSGTIADSLIGGTIARSTTVVALEQELATRSAQFAVGVAALEASVASLTAQVVALNAASQSPVLAGATYVSADPSDPTLLASGLRNVVTVAAPSWVNGSTTAQPSGRAGHSVVWTGQEMVVWGGNTSSGLYSSQGGTYRPDLDTWTAVSTVSPPSARTGHSAVWTGSKMVVWGGFSGTAYLNSGGRFSIADQTWTTVRVNGAPDPRESHVAVLAGTKIVIWGGKNFDGMLDSGSVYDPVADTWAALTTVNPPSARSAASGVWATDRLLVWGGDGTEGPLNTGAQLRFTDGNPTTWQQFSTVNAPSARSGHSAVWTGTKLIIWGGTGSSGLLGDGASYNPATDSWTTLSSANAPTARTAHTAVWTGSEMVVLGGDTAAGSTATAAAYDPALDKWRVLSNPGSPVARSQASSVWTGTEILSYGGKSNASYIASLQRVKPEPTWYFFKKP